MSKVDYAIEHLGLAIEAAASLNVSTIVIPTDVAITLHDLVLSRKSPPRTEHPHHQPSELAQLL